MVRVTRVLFPLLAGFLIVAPPLRASWVNDGVPLSTATERQQNLQITTDGARGAIVTWEDYRNASDYDVYAQRIDASGTVQWTTDGVLLCTSTDDQTGPRIISDGAGGAIVTWRDNRNGSDYDIYAQRINGSGTVQWTATGLAVCTETNDQMGPRIISDGAGGAIITWSDLRGGTYYDVYAQRISASGTAQWTTDGVPICTEAYDQLDAWLASDEAGGAVITWEDYRSGSSYDLYAQRINASGTVQWTVDGVLLSTAAGSLANPRIISDGAGGALVTFEEYRAVSYYDIEIQHISSAGTVLWTPDGHSLCTANEDQHNPQLISDGAGGAIVTWEDYRSDGLSSDIYAQHINVSGTVLWSPDGEPICTAVGSEYDPRIIPDGTGGAIISWEDYYRHGSEYDIYAQRIRSGWIQWTANGVPVCMATNYQRYPRITSDGAGGAIVTWQDVRAGANWDVYAQQIDSEGRTGYLPPVIHSVEDVPGDEGGNVNLAWDATPYDYLSGEITEYTIWRALETPAALSMLESGASTVSSPAEVAEKTPTDGGKNLFLRLASMNGTPYYWMLISTVTSYRLEHYSDITATLFDSTAVCDDYHYFQVIAHTSDPAAFWVSEPDSGYSVDNLSPCPPMDLAGEQLYDPSGLQLTWAPNTEPDLDGYNVYRGTSEGFEPGPGNLIDSPCDTTVFDGGWTWSESYYYKVAAVDIHGNESDFALLTPDDVTDAETDRVPKQTYLRQNFPNPFNPVTTIEFGLEKNSHASLSVYDALGRLVVVVFDKDLPAGHYSVVWDGRNGRGYEVSSGVYFYRLDAGSLTRTRKMILLR